MHRTKSEYIKKVNSLQAELQSAVEDGKAAIAMRSIVIQLTLDKLAAQYQDNEELGVARYKLYELQSLIYYYQQKDEEALKFIKQAVETRGESYPKAERLILKLEHNDKTILQNKPAIKAKEQKKLSGLEGWLALYIVGLGITAVLLTISVFTYGSTFNDLETMRNHAPAMYQSFQPAIWFEVLYQAASAILAVYAIVLLAKRRQRARTIAITYMLVLAIGSIIDYTWISSISSTYSLDSASALKDTSSAVGRNIMYGLIWIPYFLVSKRVKATLTL